MLKNYLLIAVRNLWKSRFFSFLNIMGLAIIVSACLLVIMLIRDAYQFDRFHPESQKTYRALIHALRKGSGSEPYATSPYPVSSALNAPSTLIKNWVPLIQRFSVEPVLD